MRNRLPIVILIVSVLSIILLSSCQQQAKEPTPTMTAPQVCQYVNQALPVKYVPQQLSSFRYEYKYSALNASWVKTAESGYWLVNVHVIKTYQRLKDGVWNYYPAQKIQEYDEQYVFYEETGALTKV